MTRNGYFSGMESKKIKPKFQIFLDIPHFKNGEKIFGENLCHKALGVATAEQYYQDGADGISLGTWPDKRKVTALRSR